MQREQKEPSEVAAQLARLKTALRGEVGTGARYGNGAQRRLRRTQMVTSALQLLWNSVVGSPVVVGNSSVAGNPDGFETSDERGRDGVGMGLAAVGSLARGDFGPCSDIDLVLMYDERRVSSDVIKRVADGLWYPIWDAGLSLDYSVRTVRQSEAVTDSDIPAAIGWLNVTPVAGDAKLIEQTSAHILDRWRKAARKRMGELETSASVRAREFGVLPYVSQPDLKEARGGLRDAVLVKALAASWLTDRPHGVFDTTVEQLLDIRDCLHLVAGRETNVLATDYQPRVAALLGLEDPTLPGDERELEACADLQALVARLGRRIAYSLDSTLSRAGHSLIHQPPRRRLVPQRLSERFSARHSAPIFESVAEGVSVHEGQVVLDTRADVVHDRALPLKVAVAAASRGMHIAPITVSSLALCPVDDASWTPQSRGLFIDLLASGPALLPVWEELDMARVPSRLIPEWDAVRNRPSASAVHRFTIDRHMVEVASRLSRISPVGESYDSKRVPELFLAGIFHDIGKRRGVSDHCAEGAKHATAILYRMGYSPETIAHAVLLIREHLTLSDFALRRDSTDRGVWRELSDVLGGDPILLDMLFDLTRADGSSLGATPNEQLTKKLGWSAWRQRLVTQMYYATRAWIVR